MVLVYPLLKPENKISLQCNYMFSLLINPIVAGVQRRVVPLKSLPVLCQSADNISDDTRKPVYEVCNQVRFRPAYSAIDWPTRPQRRIS